MDRDSYKPRDSVQRGIGAVQKGAVQRGSAEGHWRWDGQCRGEQCRRSMQRGSADLQYRAEVQRGSVEGRTTEGSAESQCR